MPTKESAINLSCIASQELPETRCRALETRTKNRSGSAFIHSLPKCLLVVLSLLIGNCRQTPQFVRIIDSDTIDSLIASVPQTRLNLDALEVQDLRPELELGLPHDSLILGQPFTLVIANDSLFIADIQSDAIFVAGLDGLLRRKIGRKGRAPLEFDGLRELAYAESLFFVGETSRLQVLSSSLDHLYTAPRNLVSSFPGRGLVASSTHLYAECHQGHDFRICPRRIEFPNDDSEPFLPSLKISEPPMDFTTFGATSDGRLVFVAFKGLPYVFVHDGNHKHIHTITLEGDAVKAHSREFKVREPGIPGVGLQSLLTAIFVLGSEYLVLPVGSDGLWHIVRILGPDRFEHARTVRLSKTLLDAAHGETPLTSPNQAVIHNDRLYVVSLFHPHVLRYPFPE